MFCALTSILLVYSAPSLSLSLSLSVSVSLCLCCVYLYPFVWVSLKAIHSRDQSAAFVAERILLAQILTCKYDDDAPWKWYKSLINIIKFAYSLSLPLSLSGCLSLICLLFVCNAPCNSIKIFISSACTAYLQHGSSESRCRCRCCVPTFASIVRTHRTRNCLANQSRGFLERLLYVAPMALH